MLVSLKVGLSLCRSIFLLLSLLAPNLLTAGQMTDCVGLYENPIRISRSLRTLQHIQTDQLCFEECVKAPKCEAYRINHERCEYHVPYGELSASSDLCWSKRNKLVEGVNASPQGS